MEKKYTDIDLSKYDNGFQNTDAIIQAQQNKVNAENALAALGDFKFSYGNQDAYDKAMNDILNRKEFSYDLNGDALYQQYKDNYINQGKMAMMDTMGQAAAMTGGYGNSYAQTVGQQTYQGHLQNLNNMIPELYKMALDRYNTEGDRLATNYGLLSTDRQNALNEYNTNLTRLTSDRDYYANDYDSVYNRDYSTWNDNRTYDTSQYWSEYNAGYQAEQDAIANELAQRQFEETVRANKASESLAWAKYNDSKKQAESEARIASAKESITNKKDFDKNSEVITRGNRGNTGNGGVKYDGTTYSSYDDYVVSKVDEMQKKYGLTTTEVNALYDYYLED